MNGRPTSARINILGRSDDGHVDIEVEDPSSGVVMFTMRLSAKQFMSRLAGRVSSEAIDCVWGPVDRLGWLRCHVTLILTNKKQLTTLVTSITKLIGGTWTAHKDDFGNHHRRHGTGYRVGFTGWLPPDSDTEAVKAKVLAKYGPREAMPAKVSS